VSEIFEAGAEVVAEESLGGYSGVVVQPCGTFEGIEGTGWRTCTQIQVTDPAAGHWAAGQLVNVETGLLRRRQ
jgi:hypothetical protein